MKSSWRTRIGGHTTPRQIEMAGITADNVRKAVERQQRKGRAFDKSWEDDFAFAVKAHKLPAITRKFLFAQKTLGRKWEADFAYPEFMLLIEIDGGVWRRGGGAPEGGGGARGLQVA